MKGWINLVPPAHTSHGTLGQNKGLVVLTQILKAQLLDLPGLPNLISSLSPLSFPISAFYPPLPLHRRARLTIPLFISFHLCLPPRLFHNSLSYYNSFHSINSFSPYFIVPIFHRVLFINHSICSVKVSACFLALLSLPACLVSELATHSPKTQVASNVIYQTLCFGVLSSYFFV